ncbi:DUF4376 domain-containing protein [Pseudomonas sp. D3]|uniref:DUF4376 domain-containing protein n=1 Tax=Pseudomonas sp. D3 TaxID=517398 RepID=UPI0023E35AA3|nr:DUF4376 domain-containing protein [Pseudomonas sp. D3]WET12292.1 DUF4376 domain-containing protein [Pseudomonas sp. D3]
MSGFAIRTDGQGWRVVDGPKPDADDVSKTYPDPAIEVFSTLLPQPNSDVSWASVDVERDRRIDIGITFDNVLFQFRSADRENITGAAQLAFMAVILNNAQPGNLRWSNPDVDFDWIAADNSRIPMDAQTVIAFGKAAAQRKDDMIKAGRTLKDMPVIPANYTDDEWWPV